MSQDNPSELRLFVEEHPTTVVADLWRLMNEAPSQGRHADFDLIAEGLLRVILCESVPEDVQTYLSVDSDTAPRRWFWQEETQAGYRSSGVGSIVNETSVSIARSAGH